MARVSPLQKVRSMRRIARQLRDLLGLRAPRLAGVVSLSVASGFVEASTLLLLVTIASGVAAGEAEVTVDLPLLPSVEATVPELLVAAVGLALARATLQMLTGRAIARLGAESLRHVRTRAMHAYLAASWDAQSKERQSELVEVVASQSANVATSILVILTGTTQSLQLAVMIFAAVLIEPLGALTIIVGALAVFAVIRPLTRVVKAHARKRLESSMAFTRVLLETGHIMPEVRVFGVGGAVQARMDERTAEVAHDWERAEVLRRLLPSLYQLLALVLIVATLAALYEFDAEASSMGAVIIIMVRALSGSQGLQGTYNRLHEMAPFVELVRKKVKGYEASVDRRGELPLDAIGRIEFDDVSFAYVAERPALEHVSFTVEQGEAIGIVGPSGAGKSTLVQILLGMRAPTSGQYRVNGREARDYAADAWFSDLAIVPQDARLIEGTVAENIRFFRDLDDDAVERAARQANVHDDIMSWEVGYETMVGERGSTLSGGQRQRISLARALAGSPSLLVLDEPTSALDMRSESLVQESLLAMKGRVTLFIVAHRLSTLNVCDRIMVFNEGRLEHFEAAPELVATNEFYREAVELSRLP